MQAAELQILTSRHETTAKQCRDRLKSTVCQSGESRDVVERSEQNRDERAAREAARETGIPAGQSDAGQGNEEENPMDS